MGIITAMQNNNVQAFSKTAGANRRSNTGLNLRTGGEIQTANSTPIQLGITGPYEDAKQKNQNALLMEALAANQNMEKGNGLLI